MARTGVEIFGRSTANGLPIVEKRTFFVVFPGNKDHVVIGVRDPGKEGRIYDPQRGGRYTASEYAEITGGYDAFKIADL